MCILYAQLAHREAGLVDTGGLGAGPEDIGFDRDVIRGSDAEGMLEEAK